MGDGNSPSPEMGLSQKDLLSDEQRANSKSRILSDYELIQGEADIDEKGILQPTDDQIKDAKIEMGDHFYKKSQKLGEELSEAKEERDKNDLEGEKNRFSYYDKEIVKRFLIEVVLDRTHPESERYSLLVAPQGNPTEGESCTFDDVDEAKAAFRAAERFAKEEGISITTIINKAQEEAKEAVS